MTVITFKIFVSVDYRCWSQAVHRRRNSQSPRVNGARL